VSQINRRLAKDVFDFLLSEPEALSQAQVVWTGPLGVVEPDRALPTGVRLPVLYWSVLRSGWFLTLNAADPLAARAHRSRHGERQTAWLAGGQLLGLPEQDTCELWTSHDARAFAVIGQLARGANGVDWAAIDALPYVAAPITL
jgi:hypothetical protein